MKKGADGSGWQDSSTVTPELRVQRAELPSKVVVKGCTEEVGS